MEQGYVLWLTGLPSSGKTTIAMALHSYLRRLGLPVEVLDGDEVRRGLSSDLGFSADDRQEHNRRVIFVSKLLIRNGTIVIVPLISPYRKSRDLARNELKPLVEVYVNCPLEECVRRDVKGMYAEAIRGEISNFTGISDPYEEPLNPEVVVETDRLSLEDCCRRILDAVTKLEMISTVNGNRCKPLLVRDHRHKLAG